MQQKVCQYLHWKTLGSTTVGGVPFIEWCERNQPTGGFHGPRRGNERQRSRSRERGRSSKPHNSRTSRHATRPKESAFDGGETSHIVEADRSHEEFYTDDVDEDAEEDIS